MPTDPLVMANRFAMLTYLFGTLIYPHGSWDARTIWNLSARFMFLGRDNWKQLFNPHIFHSDYPLLIGSSVARLWNYRSVLDIFAPAVIGLIYLITSVGLLYSLVKLIRGVIPTKLAVLAFFASSTILVISPAQCADIPLGYFTLGALGCLGLYQQSHGHGYLLTSGVFLGLGVWTKNEGWLVAVAVLVGWVTTVLLINKSMSSIKEIYRDASMVVAAALPAIVFALIQKWFLAPPNDLIAGQGMETIARIMDVTRWFEIGQNFATQLISLEAKYSTPLGLLVLLVIVFGIRENAFAQPIIRMNLIAMSVIMGVYFFVYLVSPHDLNWHLKTSLYRLYAHLWPSAVFTMVMLIQLPREKIPRCERPCYATSWSSFCNCQVLRLSAIGFRFI